MPLKPMMIFAFHASTHMVGAGDTWVAEACGRHFIEHGVDTNEPFSANSHRAGPTEKEIAKWPGWAQKITKVAGIETAAVGAVGGAVEPHVPVETFGDVLFGKLL